MPESQASQASRESQEPRGAYEVDPLLIETAESLFGDTCSFDAVQAAEADRWAPAVWNAVVESGFSSIGLPESAGGSGGSLADLCEVIRVAGAHCAPIPLAETAMLGGWLLCAAGLPLPAGPLAVAGANPSDSLSVQASGGGVVVSGTASKVRWAQHAERIVVLAEVDGASVVVSIDPTLTTIEPGTNLAGEPTDLVTFDNIAVLPDSVGAVDDPTIFEQLRLRGSLSRTMLIAGALEAMSSLTIEYTNERTQFGKPIGRFQAVQQHLVWGAQDAAIAKITAQRACALAGVCADVTDAKFQIAAARVIANESATTATRWSHQAHGAMGMTQEYALHHLSRRLWAWRHEWARPQEWDLAVGQLVEAAGADGLYPLITS